MIQKRFLHCWPFLRGIHRSPIPSQRINHLKLWWYLRYKRQQSVEQTVTLPVIWDALTLMWHYCNAWTYCLWYPKTRHAYIKGYISYSLLPYNMQNIHRHKSFTGPNKHTINILMPEQNGWYFANDIFKYVLFLSKFRWYLFMVQ